MTYTTLSEEKHTLYALKPLKKQQIIDVLGQQSIDNLAVELETRIGPCRRDLAKGRPFQIAKEAWEYALADATEWNGGEWVGHGNNPEDVRMGAIKFDVKGLGGTWTGNSGEASVKQTLSADARIDESFLSKDSATLWKGVVDPWIQKVFVDDDYYVTVFWRNKKTLDIRLVMFAVDHQHKPIYTNSSCEFNNSGTKMLLNTIADPEQIQLYILRSKHRMEMRIRGKFFNDSDYYVDVYKFDEQTDTSK